VQKIHLQELANLFTRFKVQRIFGLHLIHGHFQIEENKIMLGTSLKSVRGCWTQPTSIADVNPAEIHGHIFKLTASGEIQAYEYRQGPTASLDDVDPVFFQELVRYLQAHHLVDLLGLQVLTNGVRPTMSEFVVADNGTVMLDERDVKARGTPFRITGFFLEESRMTEFKNGESHAPTVRGTHQVFTNDKIETEDQLMAVLRSEDIVF
jgi:6-pyruvoyl-tetrahydropterin synthase